MEVFHDGQWGTVCDDHWSIREVDVVCREMDCGTSLEANHRAFYGEGSGMIWLDNIACKGAETSLAHCKHLGFGEHNCDHKEDAGAICSGEKIPTMHLDKPTS